MRPPLHFRSYLNIPHHVPIVLDPLSGSPELYGSLLSSLDPTKVIRSVLRPRSQPSPRRGGGSFVAPG